MLSPLRILINGSYSGAVLLLNLQMEVKVISLQPLEANTYMDIPLVILRGMVRFARTEFSF